MLILTHWSCPAFIHTNVVHMWYGKHCLRLLQSRLSANQISNEVQGWGWHKYEPEKQRCQGNIRISPKHTKQLLTLFCMCCGFFFKIFFSVLGIKPCILSIARECLTTKLQCHLLCVNPRKLVALSILEI